jgi:hypothetical protein
MVYMVHKPRILPQTFQFFVLMLETKKSLPLLGNLFTEEPDKRS